MSQRDCGCPGLVTPTLDELLAVARQKPLPRVRVRERRAPPARVGATMKGWLSWRLINRQGREVAGGEGPNLILDQGLDEIATTKVKDQRDTLINPLPTYFPIIRYAAVGTDSSSPATSDTGLGSELARTDTTFATETLTRPSPGVYQLTRFIEFDYSVANGNLTEWGFSSSASAGANLFNRALFTDSEGDPDTVTKTDEEKLRLTYTLEVTLSPVTWTAGSFTVANVGTVNGAYTLLGGTAPSSAAERCAATDLVLFSALARDSLSLALGQGRALTGGFLAVGSDQSGVVYADNLTLPATNNNATLQEARDAYTPGSFERTGGAWVFDTGTGNLDPIQAFGAMGASEAFANNDCSRIGYVFTADGGDQFSKDDEHKLTIGIPTVTWGRAS